MTVILLLLLKCPIGYLICRIIIIKKEKSPILTALSFLININTIMVTSSPCAMLQLSLCRPIIDHFPSALATQVDSSLPGKMMAPAAVQLPYVRGNIVHTSNMLLINQYAR